MKQRNGFDKINQIISFSNNYTRHKKNLKEVKSQVDTYNPKRNIDFKKILHEKSTHAYLIRK